MDPRSFTTWSTLLRNVHTSALMHSCTVLHVLRSFDSLESFSGFSGFVVGSRVIGTVRFSRSKIKNHSSSPFFAVLLIFPRIFIFLYIIRPRIYHFHAVSMQFSCHPSLQKVLLSVGQAKRFGAQNPCSLSATSCQCHFSAKAEQFFQLDPPEKH